MIRMALTKANIPNFLVIGAHKSATSWLYSCLKSHPDICLPPIKEIHYFDRSKRYDSPNFLTISSPFRRFTLKSFFLRLSYLVKTHFSLNDIKNFFWYLKFNFSYYDDKWYLSLFKQKKKHQICGEVTPSYSILDITDIKKIKKLNPNLKIIFLMRNPIERAWSAFLMKVKQENLNYDNMAISDIINILSSKGIIARGDYLTILKNWSSVFPKNQVYIDYYDNIKDNPKIVLSKIFRYLDVSDNMGAINIPFNKKINASKDIPMPKEVRKFLHDKYDGDIKLLFAELKNPNIKKWLVRR